MSEEIELKLFASTPDLRKLARSPILTALAQGRSKSRVLTNLYFDTPDFFLRRRKMALRLRYVQGKRLQTLKVAAQTQSGSGARQGADGQSTLQHVLEYETEIEADRPDLSLIDSPDLQEIFSREQLESRLEPVFTTDFKRRARLVNIADSQIELAIDEGEIRSNGQRENISEAELELVSGRPSALFQLALMLSERVDCQIGRESKAARGYRLFEPSRTPAVKAQKPKLQRQIPASEAFTVLAQSCIAQMQANEKPLREAVDPEGVHQFRVGVRRFRALVSLFRKHLDPDALEILRKELGWLQSVTGPARDLDVFLNESLTPLRERLPQEDCMVGLENTLLEQKRQADATAALALKSTRYTRIILRICLWLNEGGWFKQGDPLWDRPLTEAAGPLLSKRAKAFRKLGGKKDQIGEEGLHALRIEGKKLRYALEFFSSLYPAQKVRAYRGHLVGIQDCLGSLNDALVGQDLLAGIKERACGGKRQADRARSIFLGWQAARIDQDLSKFDDAWKSYRKTKAFW